MLSKDFYIVNRYSWSEEEVGFITEILSNAGYSETKESPGGLGGGGALPLLSQIANWLSLFMGTRNITFYLSRLVAEGVLFDSIKSIAVGIWNKGKLRYRFLRPLRKAIKKPTTLTFNSKRVEIVIDLDEHAEQTSLALEKLASILAKIDGSTGMIQLKQFKSDWIVS